MVLFKTALVGAVLVVLGTLIVTVASSYVTVEVQETHARTIEPHAEFLVGDLAERTYSLPAGVLVFGSVRVTLAPSNETGDIRFMVLDSENFQRWKSGGQASFIYSTEKQGTFNFTFRTEKADVYYLVFDNRASLFKKYVVLLASYNEVTTRRIPDSRAPYVGWALLMVGGVVLVYGLARKPPIPWS